MGMDVVLLGPLPTPAVAILTRSLRADLGVMLSASHNPFEDNGIKLFGPDGFKLSDETELEIEKNVAADLSGVLVPSARLGRARRLDDAVGRYIEYVKSTFPRRLRLDGLKIVVDCANGAAYKAAPAVLWELGATVIPIGVTPDGMNINRDCGSLHTDAMCSQVVTHGADLGIALDGDADRVVMCDEHGQLLDGDQLIGTAARFLHSSGQLQGGGVVTTVMSNLGLEHYLTGLGLHLERAQVGDRYVVEKMRSGGYNIGGEQSGHIILSDHATTGDGLIAALQILAVLVGEERPVSSVVRCFTPLPQVLRNIRVTQSADIVLAEARVVQAVAAAEAELGKTGRILIRKSGTEPLIRVMAEGEDTDRVGAAVDLIIDTIRRVSEEE